MTAETSVLFDDLGLKPEILRAVADAGYTHPTPIQAQAIPVVLTGRDVLGIAQTGTGKTAGFTLPMIDRLANGRAKARMPRSLILEPTRELAAQVAENFEKYGKYERLNYALLIGGERFDEQVKKLERGVDVLIATPGRMLDLFDRGKILLADTRLLVIDEADRMLDMGFIPDIERIVSRLPTQRQTLFFSATMPPEIRRLADAFLTLPQEIQVAPPSSTSVNVEQVLVTVGARDKREALRQLIRHEELKNALIFCNRKRDIGVVTRSLERHGFSAGQLHGDMVQSMRNETLERFKAGDIRLLVCSDVAARGIDISDLSHVFNFDVPTNAEDYVHRIGRTGRAGKQGRAFTLATPGDDKYVAAIEKLIGKPVPPIADGVVDVTVDGDADAEEAEDTSGRRRRRRKPEDAQSGRSQAGRSQGDRSQGDRSQGDRSQGDRGRPTSGSGRRRADAGASAAEAPKPRDRRRSEDEDKTPAGWGDHVPAFLLRPVFRT